MPFLLCRSVLLYTSTGVPVRSVPTVPTVSMARTHSYSSAMSGPSEQSGPVPLTIPSGIPEPTVHFTRTGVPEPTVSVVQTNTLGQSGPTVQTMPQEDRSGRRWSEEKIEFYKNLIHYLILAVYYIGVCLVIGGILYWIISGFSGTEEIQIEKPISSLDAERIAWFCQEVRNSQPLTPFDSEYLFRNFNC